MASVGKQAGEPSIEGEGDGQFGAATLQQNDKQAEDGEHGEQAELEILAAMEEIVEAPEPSSPRHNGEQQCGHEEECATGKDAVPGWTFAGQAIVNEDTR